MKRKSILIFLLLLCNLSIFSNELENRIKKNHWLRDYYLNVIKEQDRNVILKYVDYYKKNPSYFDFITDEKVFWYQDFPLHFDELYYKTIDGKQYFHIWNLLEYFEINKLSNDFYEVYFTDIKVNFEYCKTQLEYGYNLRFALFQNEYPLYFLFDGDFLKIYLKDKSTILATFIAFDDEQYNNLANSIKTNNFTNISFYKPRYSDGSYEHNENMKSSNVSLNKTMLVSEKLKLRSGEATSTQVLTVMSAGTKVKILEFGKAETIDGISSN